MSNYGLPNWRAPSPDTDEGLDEIMVNWIVPSSGSERLWQDQLRQRREQDAMRRRQQWIAEYEAEIRNGSQLPRLNYPVADSTLRRLRERQGVWGAHLHGSLPQRMQIEGVDCVSEVYASDSMIFVRSPGRVTEQFVRDFPADGILAAIQASLHSLRREGYEPAEIIVSPRILAGLQAVLRERYTEPEAPSPEALAFDAALDAEFQRFLA